MPGCVGVGCWRDDVKMSVPAQASSPRTTLRGLCPALPDVFLKRFLPDTAVSSEHGALSTTCSRRNCSARLRAMGVLLRLDVQLVLDRLHAFHATCDRDRFLNLVRRIH